MSQVVAMPTAIVPEEPALRTEASGLVTAAQAMIVHDAPSYASAGEFLRRIATLRKKIGDTVDPVVDAAHRSHKAAVAMRTELLSKPTAAETLIKAKMSHWQQEQERIRLAAQEEANRKAAAEAEERRLAEALEAEERAKQLAAQNRPEEAEAAKQEVEILMNAPVVAPPVQVMSAVPKVEGVSMRTTWSAKVTDKMALIRAVAEGRASLEFVEPNLVSLNNAARSMRGTLAVPGVVAVPNTSPSTRAC